MTLRRRLYDALDSTSLTRLSRIFGTTILITIGVSVILLMLDSMEGIVSRYGDLLTVFDMVVVSIFLVEFALRLWTCVEDDRYAHPVFGRLRWFISPMSLIDLAAIAPSIVSGFAVDLRGLRLIRLLRLLRIVKAVRYVRALAVIRDVVRDRQHQLYVSLMFIVFMLIITSSLMYEVEHDDQPDKFSSIPETMWWAVASLTTVGYGDVYPVTMMGRLLAGVVAVLGVGLFAIPTGILASGFSEYALKASQNRDTDDATD